MAYSELIKNFEKVRAYMREFYVYGFKSRTEYDAKSARSYDDERRRLESWLGDYMRFTQTPEGKNVFLSVDSRVTRKNPFYIIIGLAYNPVLYERVTAACKNRAAPGAAMTGKGHNGTPVQPQPCLRSE